MMTKNMTVQLLYVVLLAIGAKERWSAAKSGFNGASSAEGWMTALAVIALIIAVMLTIWSLVKHKRSENFLRQKISELTIINNRLRKEIAEINGEPLECWEA